MILKKTIGLLSLLAGFLVGSAVLNWDFMLSIAASLSFVYLFYINTPQATILALFTSVLTNVEFFFHLPWLRIALSTLFSLLAMSFTTSYISKTLLKRRIARVIYNLLPWQ